MKGVLLLAHGSRAKQTEETLNKIRDRVLDRMHDLILETAYTEFSEVTIEKGLLNLAAQGVDDIKVIPYFLFDGIHIKKDIPEELKAFSDQNPRVKITLGATLGADDRLAEIITERIKETE